MQFPESWLRAFCNPPISTRQLADTLTMAGLEVEDAHPVAPPFSGVVVGEIKSAAPHPNADRLRVCQVDAGQGALLNIVCGAPNARAGIRVPCALAGAELPLGADGKPLRIKVSKLRGVESHGMLCSARELGISDDHGGLLELPADTPIGQDIRGALRLDDALFTLKLTPNLGHALSVYGIARELAALTGAPLQTPAFAPVSATSAEVLPVKVSAPDLCGRFSGRVIRGLNPAAPTPAWMVERLARCGQRSVSALVDISNYVMFEYGRPTHIFDRDKIRGGLDVRWGCQGESLKLLNGNTVALDPAVGVIADSATGAVESLAGIMGGDATSVTDDTTSVYVEAAFWWPQAVAGRSRRYNFATEAGYRFERGTDPDTTAAHIEHITRLILDICGTPQTVCGPVDDQQPNMPKSAPVALRVARAARIIGMPVTAQQCADVFRRLGLPFTASADVLTVTPPAYRFDLALEADLIEEVARLIGYQNLPDTPPLAPVAPRVPPADKAGSFALRRALAALGYLETINFSFVPEAWERDLAGNADPIRLLNPLASQMNVMRSSLIGSLLAVLKYNADRRAERVRVFELGRVFRRDPRIAAGDADVRGVAQPLHVAGLAWGPVARQGWTGRQPHADFYDIKGDVEALLAARGDAPSAVRFEPAGYPALHPGRSARVIVDGQDAGVLGELHPRWAQAWDLPHPPVVFELVADIVLARQLPQAQPLPRTLPVQRDIAIVVPETVTHERLMQTVGDADTAGLLREAALFDLYRPKPGAAASDIRAGEKSLAVRLTLGGQDTLTDEQADAAVCAVVECLQAGLNARLRG
ncbi:MAG: phenylalanine--tRNA ligase subunit beta [Burkholderiaceae bacterium]|jgi:phenylalanyl-tRNA synthetase beta chain|nr:phenylalanine--tRNA ligase subunit beta [Burkholderiaceae bacterium]